MILRSFLSSYLVILDVFHAASVLPIKRGQAVPFYLFYLTEEELRMEIERDVLELELRIE